MLFLSISQSSGGTRGENRFYRTEVFFGVDADGVAGRRGDVDVDAVVEEAALFEALNLFDPGGRQGCEFFERGFAVGVDAEVLAIAGEAGVVAVVGDGGARKVEGAVIAGG
jgi:hypothetical protein